MAGQDNGKVFNTHAMGQISGPRDEQGRAESYQVSKTISKIQLRQVRGPGASVGQSRRVVRVVLYRPQPDCRDTGDKTKG